MAGPLRQPGTLRIALDGGKGTVPLHFHRHVIGLEPMLQELHGHVHHLGRADRTPLKFRRPGELEKIFHYGIDVTDLFGNHIEVFLLFGAESEIPAQ